MAKKTEDNAADKPLKTPKHPLYNDAEVLFVEQGLTCNAIGEMLGLTEATLSKWRKQCNWEQQREDFLSSPGKIRQLLQQEMNKILEGNKSSVDADSLSKLAKAIQLFTNKLSLPIIISVLKDFDYFMINLDPEKAVEISEFHKLYLQDKAKSESLKIK